MADIIVKMKDGTVREFRHEGRPGGSYTKSVRLEAGFVVVANGGGGTSVTYDIVIVGASA